MAVIFGSITNDLLAMTVIILQIVYCYVTFFTYSYWKRLGVEQISPSFPFGNFRSSFMQSKHIGLYLRDVYQKTNLPIIGLYAGFKPMLLVNDVELVQRIFINDFEHFHDRGFYMGKGT